MITHLLDTSALLAHYFGEPGDDVVDGLWQVPGNRIGICVLTLPELKTRLAETLADAAEVARVFGLYVEHLTTSLSVDRAVVDIAVELRAAVPTRLPLTDAVIAACARRRSATLVHRDPHMAAIPPELVKQIVLPGK